MKEYKNNLTRALNPDRKCDPNNGISITIKDWLIPTIRLSQDPDPKHIHIEELKQNIAISQK